MQFGIKHKRRSPRPRLNFPLYFQNSKLDEGFRHILKIYFRHRMSGIEGILRFGGLDKIFGKRRRNGSERENSRNGMGRRKKFRDRSLLEGTNEPD